VPLQVTQQPVNELGTMPTAPAHRVPDPNDTIDETTGQRFLHHMTSLA
jgi:hypothetical protein